MNPTFPVTAKLKNGSSVLSVWADWLDVELLRWFYWVIVGELSSVRFSSLRRKEFVRKQRGHPLLYAGNLPRRV